MIHIDLSSETTIEKGLDGHFKYGDSTLADTEKFLINNKIVDYSIKTASEIREQLLDIGNSMYDIEIDYDQLIICKLTTQKTWKDIIKSIFEMLRKPANIF